MLVYQQWSVIDCDSVECVMQCIVNLRVLLELHYNNGNYHKYGKSKGA